MKPMKKVTDPHSIIAREIPSSREANPDGVICVATGATDLLEEEAAADTATDGDRPGKGIGVGADLRRLRTRVESS